MTPLPTVRSNTEVVCPECGALIGEVCQSPDGALIDRVHYARTITIHTRPSGEHQAVRRMREKFESIADHEVPALEALNERIDNLGNQVSSHPPHPSEEDLTPVPDTLPEGLPPSEAGDDHER